MKKFTLVLKRNFRGLSFAKFEFNTSKYRIVTNICRTAASKLEKKKSGSLLLSFWQSKIFKSADSILLNTKIK